MYRQTNMCMLELLMLKRDIMFVPDGDFTTLDIDEVIRSSLCDRTFAFFNFFFYFFIVFMYPVYDFMIIIIKHINFLIIVILIYRTRLLEGSDRTMSNLSQPGHCCEPALPRVVRKTSRDSISTFTSTDVV